MGRAYPPYPFGNRLLVETLHELAEAQPSRVYAAVPLTNDLAADGFRDVSFHDVKRMTDLLAIQIKEAWGTSSSHETIAYIGVPDLRPVLVFFAAAMNGYKLFPPSPRNPTSVNASLLEQTKCSKIVYASEVKPLVDQLCEATGAVAIEAPSFKDLLTAQAQVYAYSSKSFEEAKNDPILILHSSGSTGLPKPIFITNGTFAALDNEKTLPGVEGRTRRDYSIWDFEGGGKFFAPMPAFHLSGFLTLVVNPVFSEQSTPVIGPPTALPSGALLKEVLKHQKIRAMYIAPFMVEQLLAEPNGIDYFKGVDFVCYTGSAFSPSAGKQLVQVTDLVPLYGSTEAFQTPQLVPSKEDWAYMEWNPHFKHEMQPAENDMFELVLFADASTEKRSALNHNCPGVSEFRTRDLFKAHPSKPNLWQYFGRRDDIIVLRNGYKFTPVHSELIIGSSKLLSGVLIVGVGRLEPALLLEPKTGNEGDPETIINEAIPLIGRANAEIDDEGHINTSKILVVPPGSFTRAGKGTVIRKLTEQKFQAQIDELYANDTII